MINVTLQKNVLVHDGSYAGRIGSYNNLNTLLEGIDSINVRVISSMAKLRIKKLESLGFVVSFTNNSEDLDELDFVNYVMER